MKRAFVAIGMVGVAGAANAVLILNGSMSASENFDGLLTTGSSALFSATAGVQSAITGTTFDGVKLAGTGTANMNLVASDGSANSGAVYSYGTGTDTERALGSLASGSNTPGIGVQILNDSGSALSSITISFTQENWRSSTSTLNVLAASYAFSSTPGVTASNYLSVATGFTPVTALDLVGPEPVATNGALNGNDVANQAARSATITFSTPLAVGESLFLRWQDTNDIGNDAGLALDNFHADAVPEPASMVALGLGATVLLRRRRR